jgi:hypothetical protein
MKNVERMNFGDSALHDEEIGFADVEPDAEESLNGVLLRFVAV